MNLDVENTLKNMGFIPHAFDHKNNQWVEKHDYYYSTLGQLETKFIKGDQEVYFGIRESGHPPHLISPLPKIVVLRTDNNSDLYYSGPLAKDVDIVLNEIGAEELINQSLNKETVFIIHRLRDGSTKLIIDEKSRCSIN